MKNIRDDYLKIEKQVKDLWENFQKPSFLKQIKKVEKDGVKDKIDQLTAKSICSYVLAKQLLEEYDKTLFEEEMEEWID